MTPTRDSHAIVIGASMAGLLAARALSEHFARITLIERDTLPTDPQFRGGVPQARHVHALLARGQNIMETFFPGLNQSLVDEGVPRVDWGHDVRLYLAGRWQCNYDDALVTTLVSRIHLEWHIRQRVAQLPGVTFLEKTEVDSLLTDAERTRVTGVRLKSRIDHKSRDLIADLVVDASGRRSQAPDWFQTLGYSAPEETTINSFLGYASRWYEAKTESPGWASIAVSTDAARGHLRGGGLFCVEGNRWLLTLVGMNKDYPPTDDDGFMDFTKSLPTSLLYETIQDAKPISPIYGYRYEGSRRRHYEKLTRRPEQFILMGDAVCSFNPVYGQGMMVAAIEAQTLNQMLAYQGTTDLTGFAAKFQQAMVSASRDAWLMATGEDLRYPGTEGERPGTLIRLVQRYTNRVLEGASSDPYLARLFNRVVNLVETPTSFFRPKVVWHTLREMRTKRPPSVTGVNAAHSASVNAEVPGR